MEIKLKSHRAEVEEALADARERVLEMIGIKAEKYAKMAAPVDTGNLRNSISHATDENAAYIGTNVEYAPYQELGYTHVSGKHIAATNGGRGYLRPALQDHLDEYKKMVEQELRG